MGCGEEGTEAHATCRVLCLARDQHWIHAVVITVIIIAIALVILLDIGCGALGYLLTFP